MSGRYAVQSVDPVEGYLLHEQADDDNDFDKETIHETEEEEDAPKRLMPATDKLEISSEAWRVAAIYKSPPKRSPENMKSFDDIAPLLQTGDLVLFCGVGCSSGVVRWFTFSEWSHIGVVVRVCEDDCDNIYLLESVRNDDGLVDHFTKKRGKTGVRLVDLYAALQQNPHCYMGVVKLAWPAAAFFNGACKKLWEFIENEHEKGYESSTLVMVRLGIDMRGLGKNSLDTREYFCSELVGEALKHMDALPLSFNSSSCTPDQFFTFNFGLVNGVQVHSLQYVSVPPH